jgi:hypothetical protein
VALPARFREPRVWRLSFRAAWWVARYALLYMLLCLVVWLGESLATGDSIFLLAFSFGTFFGLPTLVMLPVLYLIGECVSTKALRPVALVVLPLIVVLLPIEAPPSRQYGLQLLVQVPVQVAFALLLRHTPAEARQADDDLLAAWDLPSVVDPRPELLPDAQARPSPDLAGTARFWYPSLLGVWLWLVLLIAGGYPLLLDWVPLGPQRAAHAMTEPGDTVAFQADPRHRYLIYQHYIQPATGETCRYGGTETEGFGTWVWTWPPKRVTFDGTAFAYLGEVSDVDGVFEMSCNTGPLLVEDNPPLTTSPTGPAAVTVLSLPVLGIGYIAMGRRRARVQHKTAVSPAAR